MLLPLRFPRLWLVFGWVLVAAATFVCLVPNGVPGTADINDKFMHSVGYFGLTLWFTGIYPRSRYWLIAISLVAMGIAIEILQGAMHAGRNADPYDVVANSFGIAAGLALALTILGGWMQRIESWIAPRA